MPASASLASTLALVPVDCYSLFGLDALKRLSGDSCWTVSQTFGTKLVRQQTLHTHKTLNTDCLFFVVYNTAGKTASTDTSNFWISVSLLLLLLCLKVQANSKYKKVNVH